MRFLPVHAAPAPLPANEALLEHLLAVGGLTRYANIIAQAEHPIRNAAQAHQLPKFPKKVKAANHVKQFFENI